MLLKARKCSKDYNWFHVSASATSAERLCRPLPVPVLESKMRSPRGGDECPCPPIYIKQKDKSMQLGYV